MRRFWWRMFGVLVVLCITLPLLIVYGLWRGLMVALQEAVNALDDAMHYEPMKKQDGA